MIQITDTVEFDETKDLESQSPEFLTWFNKEIAPKITFSDGKHGIPQTCATFDEFGRPSTWVFDKITVKAVYYTNNENYNLNKFICYGNI